MYTSPNRYSSSRLSAEPAVAVPMNDGGSGLFEACRTRFTPPEFEVACDAWHTVWIKRTAAARSFGLSPWLLREHSMNEVLEDAEARLSAQMAG